APPLLAAPPGPPPLPPSVDTMPFAPFPPGNPPGPGAPPLSPRNVEWITLPPGEPLMSMTPAIVTFPEARSVTGVFVALRVKLTVTPTGILMVVRLKIPLGGMATLVFAVGLNAPSAPVLPLLNVCALTLTGATHKQKTIDTMARVTLA